MAIFAVLLAAIPLSSFFAVLHGKADGLFATLLGQEQITENTRLVFAAITGVILVNLVVAAFLIAAWREQPDSEAAQRKKKD